MESRLWVHGFRIQLWWGKEAVHKEGVNKTGPDDAVVPSCRHSADSSSIYSYITLVSLPHLAALTAPTQIPFCLQKANSSIDQYF